MWDVTCTLAGLLAGVLIGQWRWDRYIKSKYVLVPKQIGLMPREVRECLSQFLERYREGMIGEEIAEVWAELLRGMMEQGLGKLKGDPR